MTSSKYDPSEGGLEVFGFRPNSYRSYAVRGSREEVEWPHPPLSSLPTAQRAVGRGDQYIFGGVARRRRATPPKPPGENQLRNSYPKRKGGRVLRDRFALWQAGGLIYPSPHRFTAWRGANAEPRRAPPGSQQSRMDSLYRPTPWIPPYPASSNSPSKGVRGAPSAPHPFSP